ncbi:MAG TPA: hypothetical protein VJY62_19085 [Bacteroidia bacterium]|nr:hypothetical protein [Bacteroidia bacterium]
MIKKLPYLILLFSFLFSACKKKDDFTSVKVTYYVKIADSNSVNISYNSDYYFDSGSRKTISYTSNGGIWVASHIADKQEDFYIKVDYTNALKPDTAFEVKVIFNDTLVKDSVAYNMVVSPVELQGTVTN